MAASIKTKPGLEREGKSQLLTFRPNLVIRAFICFASYTV